MSDDLIPWLRAQLDEEEAVARKAFLRLSPNDDHWVGDFESGMKVRTAAGHLVVTHSWPNEIEHIARHDPARVLAEVEAKRRILEEEQGWVVAREINFQTSGGYVHVEGHDLDLTYAEFQERFCVPKPPSKIVKLLALPYADRPGYREEWRPSATLPA